MPLQKWWSLPLSSLNRRPREVFRRHFGLFLLLHPKTAQISRVKTGPSPFFLETTRSYHDDFHPGQIPFHPLAFIICRDREIENGIRAFIYLERVKKMYLPDQTDSRGMKKKEKEEILSDQCWSWVGRLVQVTRLSMNRFTSLSRVSHHACWQYYSWIQIGSFRLLNAPNCQPLFFHTAPRWHVWQVYKKLPPSLSRHVETRSMLSR